MCDSGKKAEDNRGISWVTMMFQGSSPIGAYGALWWGMCVMKEVVCVYVCGGGDMGTLIIFSSILLCL